MGPKLIGWVCLATLALTLSVATAADTFPTDADIKKILRERIEVAGKGVGIVVGVIDEKGSRVVSYGWTDGSKKSEVNGDSVFEIGSITKTFTSLMLADMVKHGGVKLEDPVAKFLPKTVKLPTRNGQEIKLMDLASHTSGLPRMPDNMTPRDAANPYADYTVEQMYDFLGRYELPRNIGEKYEYSNLGAALLGHILTLKAGTNYEALVLARVCGPVGMTNTSITLSPEMKAKLATGHSEGNMPVENWDLGTFAGAGALRSTANDMLKYAAVNLGLAKSSLLPAMQLAQQSRHGANSDNTEIGLAWHITKKDGVEMTWHNGGTGGYRTFIGLDKKRKCGVVVLANSANSIDDIGFHLLDERSELTHVEPAKTHTAKKVDAKILDGYVGRYKLTSLAFFNVRRVGDRLEAQLTGQDYYEIFPEDETTFFYDVVDAQIMFNRDANGRATGLVLHQNGLDQTAEKISDEPTKERVAIHIDPKTYDAYAGTYQLAPGAVFTVRHDADRLMVQLTGQPFAEIFPESTTNFFYKIVDAQLTFVTNKDGATTALILHQNGLDQMAARTKP